MLLVLAAAGAAVSSAVVPEGGGGGRRGEKVDENKRNTGFISWELQRRLRSQAPLIFIFSCCQDCFVQLCSFFFSVLFFPLSPSFPPHRLEINTTTPAVHDAAGATRCSPRERRCICKVDQPARRCTETRHRVAIGCFWWSCATQTCLEAHVLRMFQPLLASSSVFFFFL